MVAEFKPKTYLIEVDFLEGWEILNSLIERQHRLDPQGEPTLTTLAKRAEQKVRDAVGIPAEEWSESEMRFAWGDR